MPQYPNISRAVALLVLVYLIQAVIFIPVAALGPATASAFMENPLTIAIFNTVSIGSVLLIGLRRTGASFREVFPLAPISPSLLLPMSLTVIGMSIILSEANNYLLKFLPIPPQIAKVFQDVFGTPEKFLGALLTAVIVAPLTEELLFRGLLLRGFLNNYSVRKAIIVSALLFGVFHILPWQIPSAAILGAIFAWWFVQTRSLLPCLFGHALNNGLTLIPLIAPQLKIPGYFNESPDQVVFQPLWFDALGVLLAGIGMWWLHREFVEMNAERSRELSAASSANPAFSDNGRMENQQ
ncbi:CPBP family intramembrane metalloprotease [candidate division KSB1 bacterium]|nr:CPBP family intramembrane metalloprotease [candidate division KSB1 bacterium]